VDIGNLVGAGQATLLSTIYRIDPIYAYFNINEKDLVRAMNKDEEDGHRDLKPFPVYLAIEGEQGYPNKGILDYASTALDTSTGTLLLRGIFDNPLNGGMPKMLPGMFVRVRIPLETVPDALFVSERAIGVDQAGPYVLVVNEKNVVEQRTVRIGSRENGMRAIRKGLKKEDWVVVNGLQRALPGAVVTPVQKEIQPPGHAKTEAQTPTPSVYQTEATPKSKAANTASSPKR